MDKDTKDPLNPSETPTQEVTENETSTSESNVEQQSDALEVTETTEQTSQESSSEVVTEELVPREPEKDEKKSKPKTVWYGIIAAFVALLGAGAVIVALQGENASDEPVASQEQQEPQARVTTLGAEVAIAEGAVEISTDGGTTWSETEGSDSVANLDYVRTLDDSRAVILFDDGSVARLDKNTEVYLSSLERDGLEMTLVSGQVYTRVVESENTPFTVVTSNERFTSLGTAFKTATDGEKDTLDVYQSNVKVVSADVEVTEGNSYDTDTKSLSAIDLEGLQEDEFAQWNKEKDSESEEFKDKLGVLGVDKAETEEVDPQTSTPRSSSAGDEASIVLSGSTFDSGINLSWTTSGVTDSNGYKIVRSTSGDPTYGQDEAQYVGMKASSYKWWDDNGGTFTYRVCVYRENGTCDTYSNAVEVTSPKVEKEPVVSGDIDLAIDGNSLSWSLDGGTAPHGFKVVLSSSTGPEYPADSIQYVSSESTAATLPSKSPGTYFVRVCKYTNGTETSGCVDYSNEVEYIVTSS